ncbi:Leu/Ile/Val-binding protein precursor [Marinomonas aquimarina]|uniref:Leu/Ile/Val-binding protein n=1 Tax=Marinomonas aquimarina TaxID=295068 RepID=A0A1A8TA27_9GAMM|nr:ABC transporter substrate-binding protein [Marinomonas aquimarina]SBS29668.1 Leu/Ile/Val-binding protein precursor [Marinomonas aquimarina]
MRQRHAVLSTLLLGLLCLLSFNSRAEELRFGFTGPLTGPSAKIGAELVQGIELGFSRINASKQLPYSLKLIAKDDGYEPKLTPPLIRSMVEQDNIAGLISSVGTPTIVSATPTLKKYQIPLIFPISGSSALKHSDIRQLIFTERASYHDEATLLVKTVVEKFGIAPSDIAVYLQKDSYGEGTLRSINEALQSYGHGKAHDLLQLYYDRNHPAAEDAVAKILSQPKQPKAIFLISTYPAAAELISLLDQVGVSPLFATFSFVSHDTLIAELQHTQAKLLSTLVRPCMEQSQSPLIQEFFADVLEYGNLETTSPMELEGYLAARYVEAVLLQRVTSTAPSRSELLDLLRAYQESQLAATSALVIPQELEHSQYPIWLEFKDLKNKQSYCGSAIPSELIRGSL